MTAVDANVALWERVCSASEAGAAPRRFLRGLEGAFYDPVAYRAQQSGAWAAAAEALTRLDGRVKC